MSRLYYQAVIVATAFVLLSGCGGVVNPVTAVPAMALGAYEKSGKREQWQEYAKNGDVYAQYELAESYCCSYSEGSADVHKAFYWYCRSAKRGHGKAQVALGDLYTGERELTNFSIARDDVQGYYWYWMASRRMNYDGKKRMKELAEQLSPEQMMAAERLLSVPKRQMQCEQAIPVEKFQEITASLRK